MRLLLIGVIFSACAVTDDFDSDKCIYNRKMVDGHQRIEKICPEKVDIEWDILDRDTWRDIRDVRRNNL